MDQRALEKLKGPRSVFMRSINALLLLTQLNSGGLLVSAIDGTLFNHIPISALDLESVTKRNVENMIGAIQVPLGWQDRFVSMGNLHG